MKKRYVISKIPIAVILAFSILLLSGSVSGITTKEGPFHSVGNNFLVIKNQNNHPAVGSLFDNTTIWIDVENDGVWDYRFSRDRAESLDFRNVPIQGVIEEGARIKTSKPVIYNQKLIKNADERSYVSVPPMDSLSSSYLTKEGSVVASPPIKITLDYGNNGVQNFIKTVENEKGLQIDFESQTSFRELHNQGNKIYLKLNPSRIHDFRIHSIKLKTSENSTSQIGTQNYNSSTFILPENLKYIIINASGGYGSLDIYAKDAESNKRIGKLSSIDFRNGGEKIKKKIKPAKFARISADKPFYLHNRRTVETPTAERFYTPWNKIKVFSPYRNTTLKVDLNNDRHFDRVLKPESLESEYKVEKGSYIVSNKPVRLYYKIKEGYVAAPPAEAIGSDLWISSPSAGFEKAKVTGIFREKTNLSFDNIADLGREPDKFSEIDVTKGSRQERLNSDGSHITADKPVMATYQLARGDKEYNGNMFPYSKITTLHRSRQKYLGGEELAPMEVRVMNPFYSTNISDLELEVNINSEFDIPDLDRDGKIAVKVQKLDLNNDTAESSEETVEVNYERKGNSFVFSLEKKDSGQLSELKSLSYLRLRYRVETPEKLGTYRFDPVKLDYEAKTWKLPGEKGP